MNESIFNLIKIKQHRLWDSKNLTTATQPTNNNSSTAAFVATKYSVPSAGSDPPMASNATPQDAVIIPCLLYTSPSPRDLSTSRMPSSA